MVRVSHLLGQNTNVMPVNSWANRPLVGYGPVFDVGLQVVRIFLHKLGRCRIAPVAEEQRRTNQSGDIRSQRRGRIAACFFPPLLLRYGPVADQISGALAH